MPKGLATKLTSSRKKIWIAGQNHGRDGDQPLIDLVAQAQNKSVGGEQPGPEEQRAFLPGPEGGEFVGPGQGAVGMMQDVGDRKIVSERGIDQRARSDQQRPKRRHAGAPGRFRQPIANARLCGQPQ